MPVESGSNGRDDIVRASIEGEVFDDSLATDRIVGSPLSDRLIRAHMEAGNIVIYPFNEANLQSSSYDLRLGRYYYEEKDPDFNFTLFNPYLPRHVQRVWGENYCQAERARTVMGRYPGIKEEEWEGIDPEDEIILLGPGRTYLCHTEEFIGYRNIGTTMMKARSTLGRVFIEICKCAGWGDIGYINRWTMEVTNNSRHFTIPLVVRTRVAQLVFFFTGKTDRPYPGSGSYQSTDDLEKLRRDWDPTAMLPKLKKN